MKIYLKPELNMEIFDVEDVITISAGGSIGGDVSGTEGREPDPENPYDGDICGPTPEVFSFEQEQDIMGAPNPFMEDMLPFDTEISGGNLLQESLNTMVENIINHF